MIEDKLTQAQRIRLEAVSQANMSRLSMTTEEMLENADKIEEFILNGKKEQA